jgi:hypothetical protein
VKTATRPSYYFTPYRIPAGLGNPRIVPGKVTIYEYRNGESNVIVPCLQVYGDYFSEILKRGIPYEDAKTLFYNIGDTIAPARFPKTTIVP